MSEVGKTGDDAGRGGPRLDAGGAIVDEKACRGCGYCLKGVAFSGVCPECGLAIEESKRSMFLRDADASYVAGLRRGVVLIMAAGCIMLAYVVQTVPLQMLLVALGVSPMPLIVIHGVFTGALMIGLLLHVAGYVLYSRAEPGRLMENGGETARRMLRWSLAVQALLVAASMGLESLPAMGPVEWLDYAVRIASYAAMMICFYASMVYTRWVAGRVPDIKLDERAQRFMWLGPCLTVLLACVLLAGPIVALCMYITIFNTLRKDLGLIAQEQRKRLDAIYTDTRVPFAG